MRRKEEKSKKIFALDIASSGIKAIAVEAYEDNAIKIISEENRKADAIKNGVILQPSGTAFNVNSLLKELKNSSRFKENIRNYAIGIGGKNMKIIHETYYHKLDKKRRITEEDIDLMAYQCGLENQSESYEVYDVIPVKYEVDGYETENPEGRIGQHIKGKYHLIIGSGDLKSYLQKMLERVGSHQATPIQIAPEAFAIAVSEEEDRKEGCAIIDMGASSTTLMIYKNEILQYLLVVPLGAANITKDIQSLGISEAHAEKLKCRFGEALEEAVEQIQKIRIPKEKEGEKDLLLATTTLAMIIEARLDEIFFPIFYVLKEHQSMIPKGIIISGGGAKLGNIDRYIEAKSGFPCSFGDHSGWLTEDTDPKYQDPIYAQIIGIVLLSLDNEIGFEGLKEGQLDLFEVESPQTQSGKETRKGKGKKKKGSGFTDKIAQGVFKFFDEDAPLKE